MKNRWDTRLAAEHARDPETGLRVYSSQLLGAEPDLVLHGGGNTSVKGSFTDVFGIEGRVLYVKGSGWDLRTIKAAGFPPVRLDYLLQLGELPGLGDSEMMRQLRLALLDPMAPTPSVEAILHALIPHTYVDHSHADAVVAISNTLDGEASLRNIYGDEVLILPYIMPGFILARQVAEATQNLDWSRIRGIILLHHGIFTFHEDAKTSYDTMIELVSKAEAYLQQAGSAQLALADSAVDAADCLALSALRREAGKLLQTPVLLRLDHSAEAAGFASLQECGELINRGPLTPDHSIHTKPFGAVFSGSTGKDLVAGLQEFGKNYRSYFNEHAQSHHQMLDLMPRFGVWRQKGMVYLAANAQRLQIVQDICEHTVKAIQWGELLGGWDALPRRDLFDVEYWELEQAKLKKAGVRAEFAGKVVVVSGAASGIGKATAEHFVALGAIVVALDISPSVAAMFESETVLALQCDVTDASAIDAVLQKAIIQFGGIDVLVSNAGNFPASERLEAMSDNSWEQSIALNLTAHMKLLRACVPYLKNGFDPAVVIVASKNVPAPGPGAAAYSAAKAGLTQMARVAALELGAEGIRVNTLHPNAVYDTAIWTDAVLQSRAAHYGQTVAEYKTANVLRTEVLAADVARAIALLAGKGLAKTTGAQIPVDGGNDRVI